MKWQILLSIGLGGFLGAISRFIISSWVQKITGHVFAYGTLAVNILGSFIIGFMFLYFEQSTSPFQKAFLITGLLGALTTFSTFSMETVSMLEQNLYTKAIANISINVLLCLFATMLGMMLFRRIYGI